MIAEPFLNEELPEPLGDRSQDTLSALLAGWDQLQLPLGGPLARRRLVDARIPLLQRILPLMDSLARLRDAADHAVQPGMPDAADPTVVQNWATSIKALHRHFEKFLAAEGVRAIASVGQPVNLDVHDVVSVQPAPPGGAKNVVVQELECGYRLGPVVIRDARVVVQK